MNKLSLFQNGDKYCQIYFCCMECCCCTILLLLLHFLHFFFFLHSIQGSRATQDIGLVNDTITSVSHFYLSTSVDKFYLLFFCLCSSLTICLYILILFLIPSKFCCWSMFLSKCYETNPYMQNSNKECTNMFYRTLSFIFLLLYLIIKNFNVFLFIPFHLYFASQFSLIVF